MAAFVHAVRLFKTIGLLRFRLAQRAFGKYTIEREGGYFTGIGYRLLWEVF